ncbi:unnamed protein product [Symbiodinium sp. CCMP2592]|nr:unnamed protein product [Symbiodinium sp. CCMP2592]
MYFRKLHRAAKERGTLLRKQRLQGMLTLAHKAAADHDYREHHKLINQLAPRAVYRKFQLRIDGKLLTPAEEVAEMRKHFEKLYKSEDATNHLLAVALTEDVTACQHEVKQALQRLPGSKAGLPGSSPGAVWRMCSDITAPAIAEHLTHSWRAGETTVSDQWVIAKLALLLKPGKPGTLPTHYRPIGLIDALGKSIISMLMDKIRFDVTQYILDTPQFAYIKGRSTQEAPRRVFHHCSMAKDLRSRNRSTLYNRRLGRRPAPLAGGLQICIDLSTAFDLVPRQELAEALAEAGVQEGPAQLLLHWIGRSRYRITIEDCSAEVCSSRGVKQGCPVSPLLFAAFTSMLLRRMDQRLEMGWTARHMTLYADDFHASGLFHTRHELDRLCQGVGVVIAVLRKHGMIDNAEKAAVILTVGGTQRKAALAEFTKVVKGTRFLRVRASGEDLLLPIVEKTVYLGAVASYRNFTEQTLQHRLEYHSLSTLRWHITKVHKLYMRKVRFNRAQHALQGMPICALCGVAFARWEVLETHVTQQRCTQELPTERLDSQPAMCTEETSVNQNASSAKDAVALSSAVPHLSRPDDDKPCHRQQETQRPTGMSVPKVDTQEERSAPAVMTSLARLTEAMQVLRLSGLQGLMRAEWINVEPSRRASTVDKPGPIRDNTLPLASRSGKPALLHYNMGMNPAAADSAMEELFGPVMRGKRPTTAEPTDTANAPERQNKASKPNSGGKGKGHRYGRGNRSGGQQGGESQGQTHQQRGQQGQQETLRLVTRLLMHHQEAISTLRLSTGWVWWLKIPAPSPIPALVQAAKVWRESVVKPDSKLKNTPIRQAMFWSLIEFIKSSVQSPSEETLKTVKSSGWANDAGLWIYQRWCPDLKALTVDTARTPISPGELLRILQEIQGLLHPDTLSRFHALRGLEEGMEGQTVRVLMDVANRCSEANQLFDLLTQLQGCAALQLAGVQFRRETMQRPPTLQQLLDRVYS